MQCLSLQVDGHRPGVRWMNNQSVVCFELCLPFSMREKRHCWVMGGGVFLKHLLEPQNTVHRRDPPPWAGERVCGAFRFLQGLHPQGGGPGLIQPQSMNLPILVSCRFCLGWVVRFLHTDLGEELRFVTGATAAHAVPHDAVCLGNGFFFFLHPYLPPTHTERRRRVVTYPELRRLPGL